MQRTLKTVCVLTFVVALSLAAAPAPTQPVMTTNAPMVATPMTKPAAPVVMQPAAPVVMQPAAPAAATVPTAVPTTVPTTTPSSVMAAPAAKKDSTGSVVGGILLQILIVFLTIALPIVLTPLIRWLLKKMKIEDAKIHQMVDYTVDKAIVIGLNYANEQAHKLRDNPVGSAEKLNLAADKAIEYLKDSGIVDKSAEYIKGLIEAKLGEYRGDVDTAKEPVA